MKLKKAIDEFMYIRSDVPQPAVTKLSVSEVFDEETGKPRPITVMRHFVREGRLEEETALAIILQAGALLREESTMIEIEAPVTGKTATPHTSPSPSLQCVVTFTVSSTTSSSSSRSAETPAAPSTCSLEIMLTGDTLALR